MLIRQSYLSAKLQNERELKQKKAFIANKRKKSKFKPIPNQRRYYDELGYEYGYDSSDPCPPGAEPVYEDSEDYELHKYT